MTNTSLITMLSTLAIGQAPPGINTNPKKPAGKLPDPVEDTFESPIQISGVEQSTHLSVVDAALRRGFSDPITNRMKDLGLKQFFSNGSFSREGDTGRYYWQPNGTVFYTGGIYNSKYNPPATLINDSWDTKKDKALSWTTSIAKLDLAPNDDGSFRCQRNNCTGKYFLQPNGSIWYEGGSIDGNNTNPQTYKADSGWDSNLKEPDPVTKYKITPHGNDWVHTQSKTILTNEQLDQLRSKGCFTVPNDPRNYLILEDGRVFTPGGGADPKNPLLGGYITNGVWAEDPRTKGGSAYLTAYDKLIPANDGSGEFTKPGTGYRYIAQEDGSIFQYHPEWFTGNRDVWGPITLRNNGWQFVGPIKPQDYIRVYGLTQQPNGSYTNPKLYNGKFCLKENKLYWLSSDDSKCFLLNNEGKWIDQKAKK